MTTHQYIPRYSHSLFSIKKSFSVQTRIYATGSRYFLSPFLQTFFARVGRHPTKLPETQHPNFQFWMQIYWIALFVYSICIDSKLSAACMCIHHWLVWYEAYLLLFIDFLESDRSMDRNLNKTRFRDLPCICFCYLIRSLRLTEKAPRTSRLSFLLVSIEDDEMSPLNNRMMR